ncbi:XdhC family protein [Streptomyces sp. NPDC018972]|uniref:XdhC family protein n=1 Tax=Streptomyces sp. NPDC018972 TaxID=3365060 RepID=UPI0037BC52CF
MNDMWERLHRFWAAGTPCGVATVVSAYGSAPRRPGAVMICAPDGTVAGSVSGGCVEGAVYDLAQQVVQDGTPVLERYAVSDDDAGAVGLTCGGTIEVLVERVDRRSFPELGALLRRIRAGEAVAVATVVEATGPVRAGVHLVCWDGGTSGTTGDPALDGDIAAAARRLLARGRSGTVRESADADSRTGPRVFVHCMAPPPRMLVYGSNEFASALARQGTLLGFRVTVCDARPVFTTPERFPDADEVVVDWPHRHLTAEAAAGRTDGRTAVVSLTHDPKFDVPLLRAALRMDLAYVGALGSRRTAEQRRASLRAAGVGDDRLARLCSPAGLDLGGAGPAQTALSIASEMLLLRHSGSGDRLSGTRGAVHRESPVAVLSPSGAHHR